MRPLATVSISIYYVHKLDAQRKLMPYVAGYGPGRARPMGPLQRLGRRSASNCEKEATAEREARDTRTGLAP